jgi:hypothetical protein
MTNFSLPKYLQKNSITQDITLCMELAYEPKNSNETKDS